MSSSDVVVAAVDSNERYLSAVKWWFSFWDVIGPRCTRPIEPVLLAINLNNSALPAIVGSRVVHISVPNFVNTAFAAQTARIFWPATQLSLYGRIVTTDIDLLPASTKMFDQTTSVPETDFIIYRDVLKEEQQVPIAYNSATPRVWNEVMGNLDVSEAIKLAWSGIDHYSGDPGGPGWFTDQELLFSNVHRWEARGGRVLRLSDKATRHRRLDRSYPTLWRRISAPLLRLDLFTDFHIPMPAHEHEMELSRALSFLK